MTGLSKRRAALERPLNLVFRPIMCTPHGATETARPRLDQQNRDLLPYPLSGQPPMAKHRRASPRPVRPKPFENRLLGSPETSRAAPPVPPSRPRYLEAVALYEQGMAALQSPRVRAGIFHAALGPVAISPRRRSFTSASACISTSATVIWRPGPRRRPRRKSGYLPRRWPSTPARLRRSPRPSSCGKQGIPERRSRPLYARVGPVAAR